jgi:hypothetical protein
MRWLQTVTVVFTTQKSFLIFDQGLFCCSGMCFTIGDSCFHVIGSIGLRLAACVISSATSFRVSGLFFVRVLSTDAVFHGLHARMRVLQLRAPECNAHT